MLIIRNCASGLMHVVSNLYHVVSYVHIQTFSKGAAVSDDVNWSVLGKQG